MREKKDNIFACPYCGSENSLFIDFSAGGMQEFVCDCEICCRPVIITVELDGFDAVNVTVRGENQ